MKSLLKITLIAAIFSACTTSVFAQDNQKPRMSREKMVEIQAKHIAADMQLNDETSKRFVETFCNYHKEMWSVNPRKNKVNNVKPSEMTDEQIDQEIRSKLDHSQKILDLRKKYYNEYRKFLSPKQIQQSYKMEHQMINRFKKQGKRGGNNQKRKKFQ